MNIDYCKEMKFGHDGETAEFKRISLTYYEKVFNAIPGYNLQMTLKIINFVFFISGCSAVR